MNVEGLRRLYSENAVARSFLDHAAQRERDWSETSVDRALTILNEQNVEATRGDVVALFRQLEQLGCGQFVVGRRGRPSRIVWSASIVSVGRAAVGEEQVVAELPPTVSPPGGESLTHIFHLRLDVEVTIDLPADLTPHEAERLAAFIRTLPMGE